MYSASDPTCGFLLTLTALGYYGPDLLSTTTYRVAIYGVFNFVQRPLFFRHRSDARRARTYIGVLLFECLESATNKLEKLQPLEVRVKPATYQPFKAEQEEEYGMAGWTPSQLRSKVLGPIKLVEDENA